MQWIKCSDRLPNLEDTDDMCCVLVRSGSGTVFFDMTDYAELQPEDDIEWLAGACKREGEEVSE